MFAYQMVECPRAVRVASSRSCDQPGVEVAYSGLRARSPTGKPRTMGFQVPALARGIIAVLWFSGLTR